MESIESRVAAAMEQLRQTEEAAARAEGDLSAMSETARSRDGSVEATVSAQGRVESIRFLDNRHRAMSGERLSAATMEAVDAAQAAMAQVVMETLRPLTEMADSLSLSVGDEAREAAAADWDRMFAPLRETAARGRDQQAGRGSRLRDELHEGE
ncbi:YbaB/EbfC family nucleoid-associated protein [Streptomyces lonarensis]|uniref:YbaB/EbfC family nucleoid-associated protein n=1 Tax=Streptomyces lonarensis TaxID=700599 RepID=A0A7X6D1K5_9ACTN|nr:YbaB/EbfC family nucleoid-associated protein [Streptomyces lonarensis]NJQ06534.1 YbaB/EbfC family nucleoid-associated protein [Streptomyces lonarensis]